MSDGYSVKVGKGNSLFTLTNTCTNLPFQSKDYYWLLSVDYLTNLVVYISVILSKEVSRY